MNTSLAMTKAAESADKAKEPKEAPETKEKPLSGPMQTLEGKPEVLF